MSVFKVNLNNANQGTLDVNPATGMQNAISLQRTVYVAGPNKTVRELKDGDTFDDSNYYKRYCYPAVSLENAILDLVTDDGSVYSDLPVENTYPIVYNITCLGGSSFEDNQVDIMGDTGNFAVFTQITNTSTAGDIRVRLNGLSGATFDLAQNTTQVFNYGDMSISLIEFENTVSGSAAISMQVLASVRSVSNS